MSSGSPMMRHMRRGKFPSPKVPKKGRIRLVLLLLLLIAAVKISGNLFTKAPYSRDGGIKKELKKRAVNEMSVPKEEDTGPAQKKVQVKDTWGPDYPLFFGEVFDLLKENPHDFQSTKQTVKFRKKELVVHYSLDSSLQDLARALMKRYNPLYGAVVAIHPNSGRVLAFVSHKNDSVPSLGNICSRSIFPAASIYKTITAAAAVEMADFSTNSMLPHVGRNHTLYMFQLQKELKEFREISFEQAFAQSINPVFARIGMYSLERGAISLYGQRFGFSTDIPFELEIERSRLVTPDSLFGLAELASGFNQQTTLSPLHGALIAGCISEDGRMPRPVLVDSITSADSSVYRSQKHTWRIPINEETSSQMRELMRSVPRYGTARKSFRYIKRSDRFNGIEYGGKTGSVDKDSVGRVDWFVGYARSPYDPVQRMAVGVLTVHGAFWTVHSSFIAAELIRVHLRRIQTEQERVHEELRAMGEGNAP